MLIITIGIDLTKNIFAVHGVNENGRAELVKSKVSRDQLLPLIGRVSSAGAPAPAHTTGRTCFGNTATPSNSWCRSLSRPTA